MTGNPSSASLGFTGELAGGCHWGALKVPCSVMVLGVLMGLPCCGCQLLLAWSREALGHWSGRGRVAHEHKMTAFSL